MTVLLVESDQVELELLKEVAGKRSLESHTAKTPLDAAKKISKNNYDLIIFPVDYAENRTFWQGLKHTRLKSQTVATANHTDVSKAINLLGKGVSSYIRKPINIHELELTISRSQISKDREPSSVKGQFPLQEMIQDISKYAERPPFAWRLLKEICKVLLCSKGFIILFYKAKTALGKNFELEASGFDTTQKHLIKGILKDSTTLLFKHHSIVENNVNDSSVIPKLYEKLGSYLYMPILFRSQLSCAFFLFGSKGKVDIGAGSERLSEIQHQITILWSTFQQVYEARKLAFIDELTGLYNLRYMDFALDQEIKRAERYQYPLSILFIDLDNFKQVNDSYGHLVGSQLLIGFSQVLKSCLRDVDTIMRYGGDEFVCILPQTGESNACKAAKRIRDVLCKQSFEIDQHIINLTVCIGVSSFPKHAKNKQDIITYADLAMYKGKDVKNTISIASL